LASTRTLLAGSHRYHSLTPTTAPNMETVSREHVWCAAPRGMSFSHDAGKEEERV
jgi:hypothetical protein